MSIPTASTLADALAFFNRKERNLLIRSALEYSGKAPKLSQDFCDKANKLAGIEIGIHPGSWWATDYHISWIAGALAVYLNDNQALNKGRENPPLAEHDRRLVEGNQEDVDLIISEGSHLIFIEAKGHGIWDPAQLSSKIKRLNLLYKYLGSIQPPGQSAVTFRLLLTSRRAPPVALPEALAWDQSTVPLWLPIELDAEAHYLTVSRCNDEGVASASGKRWVVLPAG